MSLRAPTAFSPTLVLLWHMSQAGGSQIDLLSEIKDDMRSRSNAI